MVLKFNWIDVFVPTAPKIAVSVLIMLVFEPGPVAPGSGVQLVDVPHAVDVAPVHVLVVPTVNVNDELASVSLTVPLHGALVFDHRVAVTVMLAPPAGVLPVVAS